MTLGGMGGAGVGSLSACCVAGRKKESEAGFSFWLRQPKAPAKACQGPAEVIPTVWVWVASSRSKANVTTLNRPGSLIRRLICSAIRTSSTRRTVQLHEPYSLCSSLQLLVNCQLSPQLQCNPPRGSFSSLSVAASPHLIRELRQC